MRILTIMFAESTVIPYTLQKQGHDVLYVAPMKQYVDYSNYEMIDSRMSFGGPDTIGVAERRWEGKAPDLILLLSPSSRVTPHVQAARTRWPNAAFIGPGNTAIAELETNRDVFKKVCTEHGIRVPGARTLSLQSLEHACEQFAFKYPVMVKPLTYEEAIDSDEKYLVAKVRSDAEMRTVMSVFKKMAADFPNPQILIEDFITGFEISCGAFFNGKRFVGPWQHHIEYKTFAAGDVGPNIDEPGVHVIRIEEPQKDVLVAEVRKMEQYLVKMDYRGYFDINFIVEEEKDRDTFGATGESLGLIPGSITPYAIEPDCRFPVPAASAMMAESDFAQVLKEVATGVEQLSWKPSKHALCAGALHIGFPFCQSMPEQFRGQAITGLSRCEKAFHHACGGYDVGFKEFYNDTQTGYMFSFVGVGSTVSEARVDLRKTWEQIKYPYIYYRTDIGNRELPTWARLGYTA